MARVSHQLWTAEIVVGFWCRNQVRNARLKSGFTLPAGKLPAIIDYPAVTVGGDEVGWAGTDRSGGRRPCVLRPTREGSSGNADSNPPRKLPPWKPLFAGDSGAGGDAGAFFGPRRQTSQFVIFHLPHPIRLAVVCSPPDPAPLQSRGLHQAHRECQESGQARDFIHLWSLRSFIVLCRLEQCPSNHNSNDIQSIALLGRVGGNGHFAEIYSSVALRLLRMFRRGVCRRYDGRLESIGQHERTIGKRNH